MTVSKFICFNDTIVENPYLFYNSDLIDDSFIFIDEVDATKETILDKIIHDGIRKYDYPDLFRLIHMGLEKRKEHPAIMYKKSDKWGKDRWTPDEYANRVFERSNEIIIKHHLNYNNKFDASSAAKKSFIFHDYRTHTITNKTSLISKVFDEVERINYILLDAKDRPHDENNIMKMFYDLFGFISFFKAFVRDIALNYQNNKKADGFPISYESSIMSILNQFHFDEELIEIFTSEIVLQSKRKIVDSAYLLDHSFYNQGFRYYDFEDDERHDLNSRIMMTSYSVTPEKLLSSICSVAKVIGLSATASIGSVTGNFDTTYLSAFPTFKIYKMSEEEQEALDEEFNSSISNYNKVSIIVKDFQKDEMYSKESWCKVFSDKMRAEYIFKKVGSGVELGNNYDEERYLRVSKAYLEFILHDDIKSMLCFLNKHPRTADRRLNSDLLLEIFTSIVEENKEKLPDEFDAPSSVVFLDSNDFETKKKKIKDNLKTGKKIFVITVYKTIGAGQNIQYEAPDIEECVIINEGTKSTEKDFDSIYLDKPTNIIPPIQPNDDNFSLARFIFFIEFLLQNGEISSKMAHDNITKAFKSLHSDKTEYIATSDVKNTPSVKADTIRCIIQAMGRICRTNQKNKNIYIFADGDLSSSFDRPISSYGRHFNPEFRKLYEHLYKKPSQEDDNQYNVDTANHISKKTNNTLTSMLQRNWSADQIRIWKTLREFVLKNPTFSEKNVGNQFIYNFYVKQPHPSSKLYYYEKNDFDEIKISFKKDNEFNNLNLVN